MQLSKPCGRRCSKAALPSVTSRRCIPPTRFQQTACTAEPAMSCQESTKFRFVAGGPGGSNVWCRQTSNTQRCRGEVGGGEKTSAAKQNDAAVCENHQPARRYRCLRPVHRCLPSTTLFLSEFVNHAAVTTRTFKRSRCKSGAKTALRTDHMTACIVRDVTHVLHAHAHVLMCTCKQSFHVLVLRLHLVVIVQTHP